MEHARPSAKAQQQEANNGYHSVHATNNGLYRPQHPIDKVFRLVRLLCELYPITSSILSFAIVGIVLFFVGRHIRMNHLEATMSTRHSISHDYTKIEYDFNFRASQMEHWCLFVSTTIIQNRKEHATGYPLAACLPLYHPHALSLSLSFCLLSLGS